MLEATDSCTETVYVPLSNEGTTVFRPTKVVRLPDGMFRLLATVGYDPETEVWQFPPGSVVECQSEERGGNLVLVATKTV